MKEKILLIGNGINNLENSSYRWETLLEDLQRYTGYEEEGNDIPFPLLYEKIFAQGIKKNKEGNYEGRLKKFISNKLKGITQNKIHERILNLTDCKNILTTNYDYSLEKTLTNDLENLTNQGFKEEKYYSLFRKRNINQKSIWHIHGEINNFFTITLGFDHYINYSQHINSYLVPGAKFNVDNIQPLNGLSRLQEMKENPISWVDFFFTSDIYIVGLNFDFVESHLWWLLTFRTRCKYEQKIPIINKIYYLIPSALVSNTKVKNKLQLFKVNEVEIIAIDKPIDSYDFYDEALNKINNGM